MQALYGHTYASALTKRHFIRGFDWTKIDDFYLLNIPNGSLSWRFSYAV